MAKVTILKSPGYSAIMAHSAEFSRRHIVHSNIVRTGPHFEAQLIMTNFAAKANAMEPVRIDDGAHACGIGITIQNDICIFRERRCGYNRECGQEQKN